MGELRCAAASLVFGALERAGEDMFEDVRQRVFGDGVDGADGGVEEMDEGEERNRGEREEMRK